MKDGLPHTTRALGRADGARARVAVIGSGITGLAAAHHLEHRAQCDAVVFEAGALPGGHARTVDVSLPDASGRVVTYGVDTGFLVYNRRTYPGLIAFFESLGVDVAASDMSFSVQSPGLSDPARKLEWSGSDLSGLFAQRRNVCSPRFLSMLAQILRFNRIGTALARSATGTLAQRSAADQLEHETVAAFLARHRFSRDFRDGYLLPMVACIWSCPVEQMLEFPVATLLRFCDNHGLMQVADRPPWFTVRGGSRRYVDAVVSRLRDVRTTAPVTRLERDGAGVIVHSPWGAERFDAVIVACHAPQALALLGTEATRHERSVLGMMHTQRNHAVLHTDASLMPQSKRAWAAWNFERASDASTSDTRPVCVHYWINRLQPLPFASDVFVSLNPCREPAPSTVIDRFDPEHPVFDLAALRAQRRLPVIQGRHRTWFAGAWCGYGFHEDGYQAGRQAAIDVLATLSQGSLQGAPTDSGEAGRDAPLPPARLAA